MSVEETDYLLKISSLVESKLQFESGWTGQRMMWLVVSQSFLFSAFAGVCKGGRPPLSWRDPEAWLAYMIPLLGLVHSTSAHISIQSAKRVDRALTIIRGKLDEELRKLPHLEHMPLLGFSNRIGKLKGTAWAGGLASHVIPISLILAWGIILIPVILGRH